MKNALICFTLISIVLLSCKKENHTQAINPQNKLYPVSFNLSGFNQQIIPINQKSKTKVNDAVSPDSSNVQRLIYKIYDSANLLKKTVTINKGEPGFGTFLDSLAAGNYTAAFVGVVDVANFREDGSKFYYVSNGTTQRTDPSESFYKKINFVVGNQYLQQNVVLQRINAQVQVVIQDAIPADVRSVSVIVGQNQSFSYFNGTSLDTATSVTSVTIPSDKIGTTNFTITTLPNLLNTHLVTIQVISYGINGVVATRKSISNIPLQPNKLSILTGNAFTSDPSGFSVTFNSVYNPDITQGF